MLKNYILPDIIRYIFNLYLDYANDVPKLENLTNIKLDKEPHVTVEEYYDKSTKNIYRKNTYLDEVLVKDETWHSNNVREYEYNYWNGKEEGIHLEWIVSKGENESKGEELVLSENYKNGIREGDFYLKHDGDISTGNYKNGKLNGKMYGSDFSNSPLYEDNYENGVKQGIHYNWDKNGTDSFFTMISDYKNGEILESNLYYPIDKIIKDISKLTKWFKTDHISKRRYIWNYDGILLESHDLIKTIEETKNI